MVLECFKIILNIKREYNLKLLSFYVMETNIQTKSKSQRKNMQADFSSN